MGKRIMYLAISGMGKTHSLKFLDPKETYIINPDDKELPWAGFEKQYIRQFRADGITPSAKGNYAITTDMKMIGELITDISNKRLEIKTVAIDTVTHAMVRSVMGDFLVDNWSKYKRYAHEFYELLKVIDATRPDLFVVMTAHVEIAEAGNDKKLLQFQIPGGKFTREALIPESKFTVVLLGEVKVVDGKPLYYAKTQTTGFDTVKSPEGMFPPVIPNNMQFIRDTVYAYYAGDKLPELPQVIKLEDNF